MKHKPTKLKGSAHRAVLRKTGRSCLLFIKHRLTAKQRQRLRRDWERMMAKPQRWPILSEGLEIIRLGTGGEMIEARKQCIEEIRALALTAAQIEALNSAPFRH